MHYLCVNFQNSTFNSSVSLCCALIHLAVTSPTGDVIEVGLFYSNSRWTVAIVFPFFGGILLHRVVNLTTIKTHLFGQVFFYYLTSNA
jgi:hypothetical protein